VPSLRHLHDVLGVVAMIATGAEPFQHHLPSCVAIHSIDDA
jgi:hypothetical protein